MSFNSAFLLAFPFFSSPPLVSFFFLIFKFNFIYFFIQQVHISHPFYTHQCIHVNPSCPIHHTTTPFSSQSLEPDFISVRATGLTSLVTDLLSSSFLKLALLLQRHTLFYCTLKILHLQFLQIEGWWQPCIEQVYQASFSQQHLLSSCLCVTFQQFSQYFKLFHYYDVLW